MSRQNKDHIYEQFARLTKALSSPKRIEILDLLSQGEKSVETIAEQASLGLKNASAQLKELRAALLIQSRREGKYVYYGLADESVSTLLAHLRRFSEDKFTEIQRISAEVFGNSASPSSMNRKQLLSQARRGRVVLLDVRPTDEYRTAHLPFAISVPLSRLKQEARSFSKNQEIVVYCRGPYCFFAKDAVEFLLSNGFKASVLRDGVREWAAEGLPLETFQSA